MLYVSYAHGFIGLCFILWLYYQFSVILEVSLLFFSYDCPNANKVIMKDMVETDWQITVSEWVSEWVSERASERASEPCNHSLYIGIIIFPHIDNT